ncbi:hypothetical protein ACFFX0_32850 [Citricoccus parietis]|uniref:Uncharacterized protein n=1 Tax=Citricoccus parietis TaxID=592307 RepID=A0ABV5G9U5_9MICC
MLITLILPRVATRRTTFGERMSSGGRNLGLRQPQVNHGLSLLHNVVSEPGCRLHQSTALLSQVLFTDRQTRWILGRRGSACGTRQRIG